MDIFGGFFKDFFRVQYWLFLGDRAVTKMKKKKKTMTQFTKNWQILASHA